MRPRKRDRKRDMKYGGLVLGGKALPTRFANKGAYATQDTGYAVLEHLFGLIDLKPSDVIVDVGCGRGRVFNYLLSQDAPCRMVGLELDPEIAADTRARLGGYPQVEIVTGDAVDNLPPDGTLFYLYNPFTFFVLRRFKEAAAALPSADRLLIIYYNCMHLDAFRDGNWRISEFQVPGHRRAAFIRFANHS